MIADHTAQTYPLTALQTSMVLASLRAPRSGAYVVQDVCRLAEPLNIPLLERAWRTVEQRHCALRTCIEIETGREGKLRQHVVDDSKISWQVLDWTGVAPGEEQQKLAEFQRQDFERGFDFDQGVPARISLIRHSERCYTLIWTIHHALLDGRSLLMLWREWFILYEGLLHGEEVRLADPRPFHDHLDWLRQQDFANAERYWSENLAGLSQTTDFIVDRLKLAATRDDEGLAKETVSLSGELTQELADFAIRHDVTLNNLVQGAWALLLSRYSGRQDVVFGVTRAGRHSSVTGAGEMAGVLVNTLPLRIAVLPDTPLLSWLQQIRKQWMAMREYEHSPLDRVWSWSGLPPGTPPFDHLMTYEHEAAGETLRSLGGNWRDRTLTRFQRTDSSLTLVAYGKPRLTLELAYAPRQFGRETIARMLGHLQSLLRNFVQQPDACLAAIPMLTEGERTWLVQERNRTEAEYPVDLCAHQLCERQARSTPEKVALEYPGGAISYGEMNRRANQLARLLRARNIEPEGLIAVCMKRSPEAVIAALAVLKAGAAFVPLDPGAPPERLAGILADTGAKLALTRAGDFPGIDSGSCELIDLDQLQSQIENQPGENLPSLAEPGNAAYAIYTSGSTGKPKAAVVTHRSLVNHTTAVSRVYGISETDRRLQFGAQGTDMFVAEIFNYLSCGATLVFGMDARRTSVQEFVRLLDHRRITITGMPSTWWKEWVAAMSEGGMTLPPSLRAVITGMEAVKPSAFQAWKEMVGDRVRWFNAYGPTEATGTTTIYEAGSSCWEGETFVPIGKPIANAKVYVLDTDGGFVPVGIAGELYIGGHGVARGYLNSPDLTAQRFLPDPFSGDPESRLYKTGDLVFNLPDGNLVFLGRVDRQVKIRGFRVELEEIEAVLARHPAVKQCAVVATGEGGLQRLAAYVVSSASEADVRLHLARLLPEHMIPSGWMSLDRLPLTASGKIDRQALPPFEPSAALRSIDSSPSTACERRLAVLWREVLGVPAVSVFDDFFRMGGDSLRATRLLLSVQDEFGVELSMAALLQSPTLGQLAARLDGGAAPGGLIALESRGSLPPLICVTTTVAGPGCYRALARRLGADQPFYLMPHLLAGPRNGNDVPGLAELTARAIRDRLPERPYTLGGYCFGGVVAYETAQLLAASGAEVRMVVLFDAAAPGYPKLLASGLGYLRHFGRWVRGSRNAVGPAEAGKLSEISGHFSTVGSLLRRKVTTRYEPRPAQFPVVQFIAAEEPISTRVLEDPRLGWRDLSQQFHLHHIGGTHGSLLDEESAVRVAGILGPLLAGGRTAQPPSRAARLFKAGTA